jgi:HEAT repeat protein
MKRGPGRPRKLGRPRKQPGAPVANKLTPKMAVAILAIVEDNQSRAEAANLAGLTEDAIRKAMRDNGAVREFYSSQVKALINFAKAKAAHTLIKELDGPNAAARVAAARTILEDSATAPAGNGMPQVPGFAILIADARSFQPPPIDVTPFTGLPMALAPRLDG